MDLVSKKTIDWTHIKQFVEVKSEALTCFKITPDKSIKNTSNYKFFKDMVDLEKKNPVNQIFDNLRGLYDGIVKKDIKKGFKIVYRTPTDYIWYEVVMKKDSINFYVICSESNSEFVWLKLEQIFPHSPIDMVDIEETRIPAEDTMIADLKLQRHNFFSIRTDYSEQAQPIEDMLVCSEDVKEDDVLKFSMRIQPFDQNYWSYKCEDWHKHTLKGKAPKRLRVTKSSLIGALFGMSDIAFHKLSELFRELHEIAFKKKSNQIVVVHSNQESREVGDISRQSHYKSTAPVFKTTMRVASHSKDYTRRAMNLKSFSNSFVDLKDTNNSIIRTAIYEEGEKLHKLAHKEVNEQKITPLSHVDVDYNVLCDKELGKIMQLPTVKVQKKHEGRLESLGRSEIGIPDAFLKEEGLHIGKAEYKGEDFDVFVPDENQDEYCLPLIAMGQMGSGKDVFAINYVVENALKGRGAVVPDVIDEEGRGMSDSIIKSLPPEKVIVLDFGDEEFVPYLDWAEGMKSTNRFSINRVSTELLKFFESEDEAGVQTARYLKEASKAVPNGTVIQFGLMFTSEEFRKRAIESCKERGDVSTAAFWEIYESLGDGRQKQIADPILNRIHKLIGDPALKPIFGQKSTGTIKFDEWLYEGKVILCKIPKKLFGTEGIRTLFHWITVKTWLAKQAMSDSMKCTSLLVINEPHQVFSGGLIDTLKEIFVESRKYGLCVMTLFHDFSQVNRELSDIMISSGANLVMLKQKNDKTWKKFMSRIEEYYSFEDCVKINMHEAMICFLSNKKDQPVVRVKLNHYPYMRGKPSYDNQEHIQKCRETYGRRIEEVESEIFEDELLILNPSKKKK
jgi:hypothetical protein